MLLFVLNVLPFVLLMLFALNVGGVATSFGRLGAHFVTKPLRDAVDKGTTSPAPTGSPVPRRAGAPPADLGRVSEVAT